MFIIITIVGNFINDVHGHTTRTELLYSPNYRDRQKIEHHKFSMFGNPLSRLHRSLQGTDLYIVIPPVSSPSV